jgi:hypothetical protein
VRETVTVLVAVSSTATVSVLPSSAIDVVVVSLVTLHVVVFVFFTIFGGIFLSEHQTNNFSFLPVLRQTLVEM